MFTSVRAAGIKSIGNAKGGLGASELHGKRLDEVSQKRIIRPQQSINWSKAGAGKGLDLVEAFKAHKKEFGAVERNKAEIGTHLIVVVPPEWLAEGGDPHSQDNKRIRKSIDEAVAWAESWQGKGSVFAYRFDLDEKGTGVVDLFTAPVFEQGRRGGKKVMTLSPNMAKERIVKLTGERTSGAAFQTSWADWAQKNMDKRLQRGKRREETNRDHVHAEIYAHEAERVKADFRKKEQELEAREKRIEENEARKLTLFNRSRVIQDKLAELESYKNGLDDYKKELDREAEKRKRELDAKEKQVRRKLQADQMEMDRKNTEANKIILRALSIDTYEKEIASLKKDVDEAGNKLRRANNQHAEYVKAAQKNAQDAENRINQFEILKKFLDFIVNFLKAAFPEVYSKVMDSWKVSPKNPNQELPDDDDEDDFSPSP